MVLMALGESEGLTSLQFILLFLGSLAAWVSSTLARERLSLASSIAVLLILASFVPTPVYTQYFCMPLPFLLVSVVVSLRDARSRERDAAAAPSARIARGGLRGGVASRRGSATRSVGG